MEIISIGQTGLNAVLHVVRPFEHVPLDTLVIFPIIKKLNHAIYLPVVILFHGQTGAHAVLHVSLVSKSELTVGHAITKHPLLNVDHVMPEQVFTQIGHHGMLAVKRVLVELR